jgi:hypothetical protein
VALQRHKRPNEGGTESLPLVYLSYSRTYKSVSQSGKITSAY